MKPVIYQATVEADAATAGRIVEAFESAAEPAADAVAMFEIGSSRCEIAAYYAAPPSRETLLRLLAAAGCGNGLGDLRIEAVPDADWVTLSQGLRPPVKAGRFFVHGSHDSDRAPSHRFVVKIDAGRAFGTAHHASTRGCLLALDDILKRKPPRRILDLGTGTGILAIAAAHATKLRVLASDNDPVATGVAAANVRANCAWPSVGTITARGFGDPCLRRLKPDLVLANLLARALHDLAPSFRRHLSPGGTIVLSGITQDQARAVAARYRAFGFIPTRRLIIDGWTTMVLVHRG